MLLWGWRNVYLRQLVYELFMSVGWEYIYIFSRAWESSVPFHIGSWTSRLFYPSVLTSRFSLSLLKLFPNHWELVSMGTPYIKQLCVNIYCPQRVSVWVSVQSIHTKRHHNALAHILYVHALAKTQHSCHRFLLCTDHAVIILEAEAWRRSWGQRKPCSRIGLVRSWGMHVCENLSKLSNRKSPSSGSLLLLKPRFTHATWARVRKQCKAVG